MIRALMAIAATSALVLAGCSSSPSGTAAGYESVAPDKEAAIATAVEAALPKLGINAAIVKVTTGDGTVIRQAFGESQVGTPATPEMRFRNGAIAISYVANLLMQFADEGKLQLDDKVSTWLPDIPHTDQVTLLDLAQMTSGYQDYVQDPKLLDELSADPFGYVSTERQLVTAAKPLLYKPGTNWNYSHTNYVILGLALEKVGGQPLVELLQAKVLDPLQLSETIANDNAPIPAPALQAYSGERRGWFKTPANKPLLEESTGWSPSWTIGHGSIQTTSIDDVATSAAAIGSGKLLSDEASVLMLSKVKQGFGKRDAKCEVCMTQIPQYTYGIGIVNSNDWWIQNPMFNGYAGIMAYLPSQQISIAIATTLKSDGFDAEGNSQNTAQALWSEIGKIMAPDQAPPGNR